MEEKTNRRFYFDNGNGKVWIPYTLESMANAFRSMITRYKLANQRAIKAESALEDVRKNALGMITSKEAIEFSKNSVRIGMITSEEANELAENLVRFGKAVQNQIRKD